MTAVEWLVRLEQPDSEMLRVLRRTYGADEFISEPRLELLRAVLKKFIERFGDRKVRIFRSPGRINLRGMHVDTHGGHLNLMTHHREVVVAASLAVDRKVTFANTAPRFEEVCFSIDTRSTRGPLNGDSVTSTTHGEFQGPEPAHRGHWGQYLRGCAVTAQHLFPTRPLRGICAVVGSDLPRGTGLGSSAALCTAVLLALLGCNGKALQPDALILAARDAEWYTGIRSGISDQAAMVLGREGELVNVALLASQRDISPARRLRFPPSLYVLVINSYTERCLSGAQSIDYARNRFAYYPALEMFRQEMRRYGVPEEMVQRVEQISDVSRSLLEISGEALFQLLRRVPEEMEITELRKRNELAGLDATYKQYFGTVPQSGRPTVIRLRGPLLFGIAESERARIFPDVLETGDFAYAGRLMSVGHDGDRCIRPDGAPCHNNTSDVALERLETSGTPIELCPGSYGAGSPVLDTLVDEALKAGALGASLTGAGIAGSVLALCRKDDVGRISKAVRRRLAATDYPALSRRGRALTEAELAGAVVPNHAVAAAGELILAMG